MVLSNSKAPIGVSQLIIRTTDMVNFCVNIIDCPYITMNNGNQVSVVSYPTVLVSIHGNMPETYYYLQRRSLQVAI